MNKIQYVCSIKILVLHIILISLLLVPKAYSYTYTFGGEFLEEEVYNKYLYKSNSRKFLATLPKKYDGGDTITRAKNQKDCGACWAFTLVGSLENHILKKSTSSYYTRDNLDLSEQQLVSCCHLKGIYGCSGGTADALHYWEDNLPVEENCFPYEGKEGFCKNCKGLNIIIKDIYSYQPYDFDSIKESIYKYGSCYLTFQIYSDFLDFWKYAPKNSTYLIEYGGYVGKHAVELIGWDDVEQAFLCKNSWGQTGPNNNGIFYFSYYNMLWMQIQIINYSIDLDLDEDGYPESEDCDDNNPNIYPGALELCDGLDNDCDGIVPVEEVIDNDLDAHPLCSDCDDNDPYSYLGAPELCDGLDNDCDGIVPVEEVIDNDFDNYLTCEDCDDNDPNIYPGAPGFHDGFANDCNKIVPVEEQKKSNHECFINSII